MELLLVEDNPGDVRLVEEALEDARLANSLHVVGDGDEALEFVHRRGEYADAPRPDLVLLDLKLPRVSGEEVLAELKGHDGLCAIPVIVLTSSGAERDVARAYDLRANAYVTKPVEPEEFLDMVRSLEEFWLRFAHLPPEVDG